MIRLTCDFFGDVLARRPTHRAFTGRLDSAPALRMLVRTGWPLPPPRTRRPRTPPSDEYGEIRHAQQTSASEGPTASQHQVTARGHQRRRGARQQAHRGAATGLGQATAALRGRGGGGGRGCPALA